MKRGSPIIVLILLLILFIVVFRKDRKSDQRSETPASWRSGKLYYTKHARCRMDCRKIDEEEVREILEKGRINHSKSDPGSRPDPKYALEGTTRDGQDVRIIFAPSKKSVAVVTVIDLGTDWECDCN